MLNREMKSLMLSLLAILLILLIWEISSLRIEIGNMGERFSITEERVNIVEWDVRFNIDKIQGAAEALIAETRRYKNPNGIKGETDEARKGKNLQDDHLPVYGKGEGPSPNIPCNPSH